MGNFNFAESVSSDYLSEKEFMGLVTVVKTKNIHLDSWDAKDCIYEIVCSYILRDEFLGYGYACQLTTNEFDEITEDVFDYLSEETN